MPSRESGLFQESSETKASDAKRASTERLLSEVLNSSHDGIMAFESVRNADGTIVDFVWTVVNPAAEQIVQRRASDIIGRRLLAEMPGNLVDGLFDAYVDVVETGQPRVFEHHYAHEELDNWFLITAVRLDDGFAVTFGDITEQKRMHVVLEHQVIHDQLTGLPNRLLLEDRIEHSLRELERSQHAVAVAFLDLDRFKVVNDSLGHAAGDDLLVQFAQRLAQSLRPTDTVARIGGDEFVVLFDHLSDQDLEPAISRLLIACDAPFEIDGREVFVGVTVGVARADSPDTSAAALIAEADAAMYEAKKLGGNRARFVHAGGLIAGADRVDLESKLRTALERDELRVVYQPIVDCRTGSIAGAEALVRWLHPERGLLAPEVFLPIAEATGLINQIGSWVLENAVRQLAAWTAAHPARSPLTVSVNASAQQLTRADFCAEVETVVRRFDLAPGALCIEVTENALIRDPDAAQRTLQDLSAAGVRIALDDFGTSYSPITHLQRFPVDVIKIDRSLVSGPDVSPGDTGLVDGLIALAAAMGKTVTAEGVEADHQLALVSSADHYQGFLFLQPVDPVEFERLLTKSDPNGHRDGSTP